MNLVMSCFHLKSNFYYGISHLDEIRLQENIIASNPPDTEMKVLISQKENKL